MHLLMLLIGMALVKEHYFGISKSQMQIFIHMRMCIMRSDGLPQTLTDHEESVRQNVMICSILAAVVKRSNLGFCLSLRPSQLCLAARGSCLRWWSRFYLLFFLSHLDLRPYSHRISPRY